MFYINRSTNKSEVEGKMKYTVLHDLNGHEPTGLIF